MAISFEKKEAVRFGDIIAKPEINVELNLRLSSLKVTTKDGFDEAIEVLSECFGEQQAEVKAFMDAHFTTYDAAVLQAYLVGGQNLVNTIEKSLLAAGSNEK